MAGGFWAGIDWSEKLNDVAVVDAAGQVVVRARIAETPDGLKELLRLLSELSRSHRHSRRQVPIAIETGSSLLVEGLRSARQPVHVIHPAMAARYRARLSPAKIKSDKGDAAMLANILRIDGDSHRPLPERRTSLDPSRSWHERKCRLAGHGSTTRTGYVPCSARSTRQP